MAILSFHNAFVTQPLSADYTLVVHFEKEFCVETQIFEA